MNVTELGQAVVELAECVKEIIRILQLVKNLPPEYASRLEKAYTKASKAKSRVE